MIKQIFLPLTIKRDQYELMFAQSDPRIRAKLDAENERYKGVVIEAEAELALAFEAGYEVVSHTTFEDRQGFYIHYLLYKPEAK